MKPRPCFICSSDVCQFSPINIFGGDSGCSKRPFIFNMRKRLTIENVLKYGKMAKIYFMWKGNVISPLRQCGMLLSVFHFGLLTSDFSLARSFHKCHQWRLWDVCSNFHGVKSTHSKGTVLWLWSIVLYILSWFHRSDLRAFLSLPPSPQIHSTLFAVN